MLDIKKILEEKQVDNYLAQQKLNKEETAIFYFKIFMHLKEIRDFINAEKYLLLALSCDENNIQYKLLLSTICLVNGHYQEGWKFYENRLSLPTYNTENILPRWNGKDKYKKIVVLVEQGYGDSFMFARFLYLLKNHFDYVSFCVSSELNNIFTPENLGIDDVSVQYIRKDFDCYCHLSSLPYLLGINQEQDLNKNYNYLENKIKKYDVSNKKLNIGFCLQGRMSTPYERTRAVNINLITELFENKKIDMHSLYQPPFDENYKHFVKQNKIIEHPEIFSDFNKTAELINAMDIIITSDTSIVHLAGTLGKPVLLLLPKLTDWRWKTKDSDTYWYDNIEISRQEIQEDWRVPTSEILEKIKHKLKQKKSWYKIFC